MMQAYGFLVSRDFTESDCVARNLAENSYQILARYPSFPQDVTIAEILELYQYYRTPIKNFSVFSRLCVEIGR